MKSSCTQLAAALWTPAAIEFAKGLPAGSVTEARMREIEAMLAALLVKYS